MDANFITALAEVLGSMSGASAAIATTWISQKSQTLRKQGQMGQPNMTMDEILATMRSNELEFFKRFSNACRVESQKYSAH